MPDFHDLLQWATALKSSPPFAIASAVLVASLLASLADWIERYLASYQQAASGRHADNPSQSGRQRERRLASAGVPVFEGNRGRSGQGF